MVQGSQARQSCFELYAMRFALCVMRVFTTCLITQSLFDSTPELPPNFFMDDTCILIKVKDKDLPPLDTLLAY
jgi:hypothetical protein